MKRAIVLAGLTLILGCGDSAELKRAQAKFHGLDQALRQAEIARLQARVDGDHERAEAEHNRCRDLEGQLRVAQLEYQAAGGDPDEIAKLEAQVIKETGADEKFKKIQADMDLRKRSSTKALSA